MDRRRPKASRGESPDSIVSTSQSSQSRASQFISDSDAGNEIPQSSDGNESEDGSSSASTPSTNDGEEDAKYISFGALAKAQSSLLGKRKRQGPAHDQPPKPSTAGREPKNNEPPSYNPQKKNQPPEKKPSRRTSHHAPAELSSKKPITRKRTVINTSKPAARDPRFSAVGAAYNAQAVAANYNFLNTYRESERAALQAAHRKTKNEDERAALKKEILRIESRKAAEEKRERERAVIRQHRREEKVKVEKGKRPFYLKKAEQKRRALVERFKGMKGKEVDRALERRRKKVAGKEKRKLPLERRSLEQ